MGKRSDGFSGDGFDNSQIGDTTVVPGSNQPKYIPPVGGFSEGFSDGFEGGGGPVPNPNYP